MYKETRYIDHDTGYNTRVSVAAGGLGLFVPEHTNTVLAGRYYHQQIQIFALLLLEYHHICVLYSLYGRFSTRRGPTASQKEAL